MRYYLPLKISSRFIRRKATNPSLNILEQGVTYSDVHSVIVNPTTKLPYPDKQLQEYLIRSTEENAKNINKSKYGTKKKMSSHYAFDHIPIEEQLVLLFPGQGAQFVGMGKKLVDSLAARNIFENASEILGYDLLKVCTEGPSTKLDQTLYCQPAVFVSSVAALEKFKEQQPESIDKITDVAGFSVGEFSALVAGEILTFEDALRIVKTRCEAMHECNQLIASGMATVKVTAKSNLTEAMLAAREEAKKLGEMEICDIANYLYCGVRVIGASNTCLDFLEKHQQEFNFQVVKRLAVSGAFHTRQMDGAVERVRKAVQKATLQNAKCNVYSNYTGHIFPYKKAEIRQAIFKQVNNPVKWEQIQQLLYRKHQEYKFPRFIEIGPGRQLGSMLLQTSKKAFKSYENIVC